MPDTIPDRHHQFHKLSAMSSSEATEIEIKPGSSIEETTQKQLPQDENNSKYVAEKKDLRFWLIVASLGITALLAGIDGTIISTTLPSISAALGGGEEYVWVSGSYFLAT